MVDGNDYGLDESSHFLVRTNLHSGGMEIADMRRIVRLLRNKEAVESMW